MCMNPVDRLGSKGGAEVKDHPWFKDVNWEKLLTADGSFIPKPQNIEDTDYFDDRGAKVLSLDDQHVVADMRMGSQDASSAIGESNLNTSPTKMGVERSSSEPRGGAEWGEFVFKNLHLLEKANADLLKKLKTDVSPAQMVRSRQRSLSGLLPMNANRRGSRPRRMSDLEQLNTLSSSSNPEITTLSASSSSSSLSLLNTNTTASGPRGPSSMKPQAVQRARRSSIPKRLRSNSNPEGMPSSPLSQKMPISADENSPPDSPSVGSRGHEVLHPVITSTANAFATEVNNGGYRERPMDVLIADDNPICCKILETILNRLNCRCVSVRNGAEAVRFAMGDVKFDLIFLDILMPISKLLFI